MARINSTNLFGLSDYIVDTSGAKGSFTTVQSALDAVSAVGNGVVYIKGSGAAYIENLAFNSDVQLIGVNSDGRLAQVLIAGSHVVADGITVTVSNIFMTSNGTPQIFDVSPTGAPTILAIKNCDLLNNTGNAISCNPTAAGQAIILLESNQVNTSSDCFVSTGLGNGTTWNVKFGDYNATGTGTFFTLDGSDRAFVDGVTGDFGGVGFQMNGATNTVQCSISRISSSLFSFSGPLGGSITTSDTVYTCNDPSGFFVTGAPDFNYAGIVLTGTAKDLNVTVGDFPATWRPYAKSGTSVTATVGTVGFNQDHFDVTLGFCSLLNPILSSTITLTSAEIKALRATPITMIPAAGAGTSFMIIQAQAKLNYGGTSPFTNPQDLALKLGIGGANISDAFQGTGFIDQSADTYAITIPSGASGGSYPASAYENVDIVLQNTGASEITGNAADDNTLVVTISYRLLNQ